MIQIDRIIINEFRGIREMALDLRSQNFAACGPNGTGKSGIVDAIEFALTGNISRLSGAGTGGLSVKAHGPHVDRRNNPEAAAVTLEVSIPALGKRAQIHRSVKAAGTPTITPSHKDVLAAFETVKLYPEFALSRRELIRYVLSEPSQRSKQVQSLLRLDDIEKLRGVLQKIANACQRELLDQNRVTAEAEKNLRLTLGIEQLDSASVLGAVNLRRAVLGLVQLQKLEADTSVKNGLTTTAAATPLRVSKVQAAASLAELRDALLALQSQAVRQACSAADARAAELGEDAASLDSLSRHALLSSAIELYDGTGCPVCDTPFTPDAFQNHVGVKLAHLDEIGKRRAALEAELNPILDTLHAAGTALTNMIELAALFIPKIDVAALVDFRAVLRGRYQQLQKVLPLADTRSILASAHVVPDLASTTSVFETATAIIPEPTTQDAAREFLVLAQERLEQYRRARLASTTNQIRSEQANNIFSYYATVTTTALEKIYAKVESTFADYYRHINQGDENYFTAKLIPSIGKLGFDVDFYGRGHFPPGAYHSEGHQDGMGLCLYLALMEHLLGTNFTFAVFDDVLMSVDAGHRRQVCTLLSERFPKTQFIFTTHDDIWLNHMKSAGLIRNRSFAHFRTWTVDLGPTEWNSRDVWDELENHLVSNDVRAAAGLLRHYLEYFATEACDRLRAAVEFRADHQFVLGDTLPRAIGSFGELLKKGKAAANSWHQKDVMERITALEIEFNEAKQKIGHDQWQINSSIHFNDWANLKREDFSPVVSAFKALVSSFNCNICEEIYRVTPSRGRKESLRCGCGNLNLNLDPKSNN